jgi:hypothetical protein
MIGVWSSQRNKNRGDERKCKPECGTHYIDLGISDVWRSDPGRTRGTGGVNDVSP